MDNETFERRKNMIYEYVSRDEYTPLKMKELAGFLSVPKQEKEDFQEVINTLISEGKIIINAKGQIRKADSDTYAGTFSGTSRGFGFVRIDGEKDDVFISPDDVHSARDKDRVLIALKTEGTRGKSREGIVLSILERGSSNIIGTFQRTKTYGFVVPDNQKFGNDIFIPHGFTKGAISGHKVEVEITDFGGEGKNPEGHVIDIIGHIDDPATDILTVVRAYGIPVEFPEGVINELTTIPREVSEAEKVGRMDLRDTLIITIDGEDAKDLDDGVSVSYDGKLYHLGVHIADVSNYVKENSPLDKEALKRGTSNYLVDSVIPMLPHELSNGICSLNMGVDRLALSCLMDIDEKGNVVGHQIAETLINVRYRCDYTHVNKVILGEDVPEYAEFKDDILLMNKLAGLLRARRMKRGSIDFDFPESKIIVNEKHEPIEVKAYERNDATRLIEDFMLIANETIAEDYFWQELPFVYRTHENPDPEKMTKLGVFINNFGYSIKMTQEDIHPKELQKLLEKIRGTEEETMISRITLRSLKQAKYTTSCEGHFGLAAKYYCHFTSPIRRYPDLQIHRIIKENLHGKLNEGRINHYTKILDDVALQASKTERRADEAEREVEKLKKVEYMSQFIGDEFDGVISGVSSWGMHVELPNTIEGTVKITEIPDDFYYFDEEHYMLVGEHTKKTYKLGQRVKVRLDNADKMLRTIEFGLVDEHETSAFDSDR
jgi:ribonuclease R